MTPATLSRRRDAPALRTTITARAIERAIAPTRPLVAKLPIPPVPHPAPSAVAATRSVAASDMSDVIPSRSRSGSPAEARRTEGRPRPTVGRQKTTEDVHEPDLFASERIESAAEGSGARSEESNRDRQRALLGARHAARTAQDGPLHGRGPAGAYSRTQPIRDNGVRRRREQ